MHLGISPIRTNICFMLYILIKDLNANKQFHSVFYTEDDEPIPV